MSDPKKRDRLFLIPGFIVWTLVLIISFGNLRAPFFSLTSPMNVAGIVLFIIGLTIRVSAAVTLNKSYSPTLEVRDDHRLVKHGVYKYIRHPIYTGVFVGVLATPVYTSSLLGFLIALMTVPLFTYRMGVEEKMLTDEYGDEYREYMKAT
jgi:protein-S-isoprenylcysteine O-methyltransferase Ste14